MKIHITNLYNFNKDDQLVQRQHKFADAGRSLGFFEMGIFAYPVETDTASELSKRLDGVIAALEPEDVVIMQLPTRNGLQYEKLLIGKIRSYKNTKIVLLVHEPIFSQLSYEVKREYEYLFSMADSVYDTIEEGYSNNEFFAKKVLLDEVAAVFAIQKNYTKSIFSVVEDEIHIGFGLHDKTGNYSVWVGVAMQSIIENTNSKICFHILHDETVSRENKDKLVQTAINGGHRICFHLLDNIFFRDVEVQMGVYTIGAMFRVMLPELLTELSKVIYLDADILVNRDIKELWDTDIENYYMAAVKDIFVNNGSVKPVVVKNEDVAAERYFNSGVLYMNLNRIRELGNMRYMILEYLKKASKSDLPDQDALNAIYGSQTLFLDGLWNYFARPVQESGERELKKCVYHFVGTRCILYSGSAMDLLYYETIKRTPWGENAARIYFKKAFERVNDRVSQLEMLLEQITLPNQKHIFYGEENYAMRNIYNLVGIREGDYRISGELLDKKDGILPCRDLSEIEQEDKFIVFVLPEADAGKGIDKLEQMGLVNGKDFFVIRRLLPVKYGGFL